MLCPQFHTLCNRTNHKMFICEGLRFCDMSLLGIITGCKHAIHGKKEKKCISNIFNMDKNC